jgi:acyl carrier protein
MDNDRLRKAISAALADVAPDVDPAALDPAASFRDQFDFDSIDHLNFVLGLEKALQTTIPELDYPQLTSLDAAEGYLAGHLTSDD